MWKRKILTLPWGALFVSVVILLITFAIGGSKPARAQTTDPRAFVSGTGTFTNQVIRCRTDLLSDCGDDDPSTVIELTVRETTLDECDGVPGTSNPAGDEFVQYSGIISNSKENGHQVTHSHREFCAPNQPSRIRFTTNHTLEDATVTDPVTGETWTGDLEVVSYGTAVGDVVVGDVNAKVVTRAVLIIKGISGQLEGAIGHGKFNGEAWFSGSLNTYSAELRLP